MSSSRLLSTIQFSKTPNDNLWTPKKRREVIMALFETPTNQVTFMVVILLFQVENLVWKNWIPQQINGFHFLVTFLWTPNWFVLKDQTSPYFFSLWARHTVFWWGLGERKKVAYRFKVTRFGSYSIYSFFFDLLDIFSLQLLESSRNQICVVDISWSFS